MKPRPPITRRLADYAATLAASGIECDMRLDTPLPSKPSEIVAWWETAGRTEYKRQHSDWRDDIENREDDIYVLRTVAPILG